MAESMSNLAKTGILLDTYSTAYKTKTQTNVIF